MDPKYLAEDVPNGTIKKITQGQVHRTLRGFDGRIRHVETLASRWENRKLEAAIEAGVVKATVDLQKAFSELNGRVQSLEARTASLTEQARDLKEAASLK